MFTLYMAIIWFIKFNLFLILMYTTFLVWFSHVITNLYQKLWTFLHKNESPGVRMSLAIKCPFIRQQSEHGRIEIKFHFMGYTI